MKTMKTKSKIAIAATAAITVSALAFSLPSLAHDGKSGTERMGSERGHSAKAMSNKAELSATITGIPSTVTDLHAATEGAYFELYKLADGATALPTTKPTTGLREVSAHPAKAADGTKTYPTISGTSYQGVVHFKASRGEGVTRYALYASDGSAAILVTVTTDAIGVSTAVASSSLTVSYDATVAADSEADEDSRKMGDRQGKGHGGKDGSRPGQGKGPRR
jgi:hypothetical protein